MRPAGLLLIATAALLASTATVAAGRGSRPVTENLISVIEPVHKSVAAAHPWINIRVRFGTASDGSAADPDTFRAWFGRCRLPKDVFEDLISGGAVVEKRARLTSDTVKRCHLKMTQRPKNRLRFKVRAVAAPGTKKRLKDTDRVRFGSAGSANLPPVPVLTVDTDVIIPGETVTFSAAQSHDPNGDWLTYEWDLGDVGGATGTGESVAHTYTTTDPVTVQLTAKDGGGLAGVAEQLLPARPALTPGKTPGTLSLAAGRQCGTSGTACTGDSDCPAAETCVQSSLDFGAVTVDTASTTNFIVRNTDSSASSELRFTVEALGNGAFTTDCPPTQSACALGPGEQRTVTVTFAPSAVGHDNAALQLLATASNRENVRLLVHGYGEQAGGPGTVPWNTAHTLFYLTRYDTVRAMRPDGTTVALDVGTGFCVGGSLDSAPCVDDRDCPGASCSERFCSGGTNNGAPCAGPRDCPDDASFPGAATCGEAFEPVDYCSDGNGSVFLVNDDVRFDTNLDRDPTQSGMIFRVDTDGNRSVVTEKVTEESIALACDRTTGGRVYWAQYDLFGPDEDERENLKSAVKDGGGITTLITNIDKRLGDVDPANYIDPQDGFVFYEQSTGLRATTDGSTIYVANFFGLYRLSPTPLLITFDVDEVFDIFPDGAILAANVVEEDTGSTIRVYKIDPNVALTGAVSLSHLAPWATMTVPNNRGACQKPCARTTFVTDVAVDPDGIVFIRFFDGGTGSAVPRALRPQGILRFEPSAGGPAGVATGFITFDRIGSLRF